MGHARVRAHVRQAHTTGGHSLHVSMWAIDLLIYSAGQCTSLVVAPAVQDSLNIEQKTVAVVDGRSEALHHVSQNHRDSAHSLLILCSLASFFVEVEEGWKSGSAEVLESTCAKANSVSGFTKVIVVTSPDLCLGRVCEAGLQQISFARQATCLCGVAEVQCCQPGC